MFAAAMITAGMSFTMVMLVMITFCIGIITELTGHKCFCRFVCITANTAIKLDTCLCKGHLCSPADSSANKNIYTKGT